MVFLSINNTVSELASTEYARDEITLYENPSNEIFNIDQDATDYMHSMNYNERFYKWIFEYSKKHGFSGEYSDSDELASFIKIKAQGLLDRTSIDNWLRGKKQSGESDEYKKIVPRGSVLSREKVYKLCFALKMNSQETKDLFFRGVLERPFNYKNINEATYYFCLNTGRDYETARKIIKNIQRDQSHENPDADNITEIIGKKISKITDIEEFEKYIKENKSGFEGQNKTAYEKINELVSECLKVATEEYSKSFQGTMDFKEKKIEESSLIFAICDRWDRQIKNGNKMSGISISKSKFPEIIKKNFPQYELLNKILSKKETSYDVIRKMLILLNFYYMFATASVNNEHFKSPLDEFEQSTNILLDQCGYCGIYWNNPYDWMFGYCSVTADPLFTLRELIANHTDGC